MIKFFRHIRQAMIKENPSYTKASAGGRFSKYMLYAIGEIVLVVIGILIALQINNWNEQRKTDIEVVKVLNEVRSNLISDSLTIRQTRITKAEDIEMQLTLIHALETGNIPYDSIEHHLGRVMIARRIVLVDNGYQLMKKFGLERLKNEALRNELINYYSTSVMRIYEDTHDDDFEFLTVFLPYVRENFLEFNWSERGIHADYEQLKSDQYFRTCLKVNLGNRESTLAALLTGANKIQEILLLLEKTIQAYD